MNTILAVAIGGAAGSVARYLLSTRVSHLLGTGFPWGTLAVNVIGCTIYGALIEVFARAWSVGGAGRTLLTVGFLGGFTTFSAFSFEVFALYERGQVVEALIYVLASVVLSILGVFAGFHLFRTLLS
jgi:CrcB protein